jgi:hypothetical protein
MDAEIIPLRAVQDEGDSYRIQGKEMQHVLANRARNTILFLFTLFFFSTSGFAASDPWAPAGSEKPPSEAFLLGKNAARSETKFYGSFATGVAFGIALPFVTGGCVALAYQSTGRNPVCGVIGGFASTSLWTWSGIRLAGRKSVEIPEQYHEGLDEQMRREFDSGYNETARDKRTTLYTLGLVSGIMIPVGMLLYFISQFEGFGGV